MTSPALSQIPLLFRWNVADGLNGQQLLARSFSTELAGVLSRTSTKRILDRNGLLIPLPQGLPPLTWIGGEPAMLLEPARTNLCIRSEEFDTWSAATLTVTANAVFAPDGSLTADLITPTASTSANLFRDVTFTGDGEKCCAIFLRAGTSARTRIDIFDATAAANRHSVNVTWVAGVPTLATLSGSGTLYPVEALGTSGWYRILFSATGIVAANTNRLCLFPDNLDGTGSVCAWGAQAENAVVPSSYIKTEGSTVTRNADSLYFPFTAPPQAMTVYVRSVELARLSSGSGGSFRKWQIGSATAATGPHVTVYDRGNVEGYAALHNNGSVTVSRPNDLLTVTRGDVSETRLVLAADGSIVLGVAENGGAETVSSATAANALAGAWADTRFYVNSAGSSFQGLAGFTHIAVAAGVRDRATMRALAGV